MDTIANFISQKEQISILQHKVHMSLNKRDKARVSMNRLKAEKVKITNLLVGLQLSGHLVIKDKELAGLLFVEAKTVVDARRSLERGIK